MGKEEIVARILSDGEKEAEAILTAAHAEAEEILSAAKARGEEALKAAEDEMLARAKRIEEGRAAAARLDCKKILLSEKRRALDCIYELAYRSLMSLGVRETVALYEKLLICYAEEGDEIVFDGEFNHEEDILALPVVKERSLTKSATKGSFGGGFLLKGKLCDRDVSYRALLEEDRTRNQAHIAAALFRNS